MSSPIDAPDTPPTPEESTGLNERVVETFRCERDEAVAELKKVKAELASVYKIMKELKKQVEEQEAKAKDKEKEKEKKKAGSSKKKKKEKGGLEVATPSLSPSAQLLLSLSTPACVHPKLPGLDPDADSKLFYTTVAEKFPNMKISDVMDAEKKFLAADKNHDGVVDVDELDRVMIVGVSVFTPGKIQEILKEVDVDENGTIDFLEALSVMEKLTGHRRINLPDQLKQNQTKVCAIQ